MFYSSCKFVCPMLIETIRDIETKLSAEEREHLTVLLVSIDPAHDSVEVLQRTVDERHVDGARWTLARTDAASVRKLAAVLGIQYRALPDGEFNHTTARDPARRRWPDRGADDPPRRRRSGLRQAREVAAGGGAPLRATGERGARPAALASSTGMRSLHLVDETRGPSAPRFAFWELGFRPFYLLASVFAALSIPLWALQFSGVLGHAYLAGPIWHAHEMLFGFTLAVIVGFLFTAGRNWTGPADADAASRSRPSPRCGSPAASSC